MSLDIFLVLLIAITQLVTAIYGVLVSITEKHFKTAVTLGIIGGVGVILTVCAAMRGERAQERLEGEIRKIQTNTETPPKVVVNVPPSAPPMVTVIPPQAQRDTRGDLVGEVEVMNMQLTPNSKLLFNLKLLNRNSPPVDGVIRYFAVGVGTIPNTDNWLSEEDSKVDREMGRKFHQDAMKDVRSHKNAPGMTVETGKGIFNTVGIGPLTQQDIDDIMKGKTRIYSYIWGRWKGSSRDLEECEWMQNPPTADIDNQHVVWHACTP